MKQNDQKNQCCKYIAPALVAGAAIFGVTGAIAGFNAVIKDDGNYITCNISELIQGDDGTVQLVLDPNANCANYLNEGTLADSLKFVSNGYNGTLQAGCTFSKTELTSDGQLLIKTEGQCISTEGVYNVADIDYNCFIDENNDAFVLNIPSYDSNNICDETLPASITAGNVAVSGPNPVEVEFRTQGTIRILPPFSVANQHVFIARTGQISGNP
ncbi:hypothetical protein [Thiolapillus sp.]